VAPRSRPVRHGVRLALRRFTEPHKSRQHAPPYQQEEHRHKARLIQAFCSGLFMR